MLEVFFLRLEERNMQQNNSYVYYCHSETADRRYQKSVQKTPTQTLCYSRNDVCGLPKVHGIGIL